MVTNLFLKSAIPIIHVIYIFIQQYNPVKTCLPLDSNQFIKQCLFRCILGSHTELTLILRSFQLKNYILKSSKFKYLIVLNITPYS